MLLKKLRQEAIYLTTLGLSYSQVGKLLGFAKSTLCKWLKKEEKPKSSLGKGVIEVDGLWCRTRGGREEMKLVRDSQGVVKLSFGNWEEVIDRLFCEGMEALEHVVSDGDRAIEEALGLVYGRGVPHQLCHFHLLQEYRRNIGKRGWQEAKALLRSKRWEEAQGWSERLLMETEGKAAYWCRKALEKGLTFLHTGQGRWKSISRLERLQRELRRRERMGTGWSLHNLEVLLSLQTTSTT